MQAFYKELPQYKNNSLYITGGNLHSYSRNITLLFSGESYAGHYVPAISHYIWQENTNATDEEKIPLKGLAIGNGLTNVEEQYSEYPDMALDGGKSQGGSLEEGVITNQYGNGH